MQLEGLGFGLLWGFSCLQVFMCESKVVATALGAVLVILSHPPDCTKHTVLFLHALKMTVTFY